MPPKLLGPPCLTAPRVMANAYTSCNAVDGLMASKRGDRAKADLKKAGKDVKKAGKDIENAVERGARDVKKAGGKLKKKL